MSERQSKLDLLDFLVEEHEKEELAYDAFVEGFVKGLMYDHDAENTPDSRGEVFDWLGGQYVDYRTGRGDYRIDWFKLIDADVGERDA